MIKLIDYQKFCLIPTGETFTKEVSKLLELDVNGLNDKQVQEKINKWVSKIIVSKKKHTHIKLGKTWYKVNRDLYNLSFGQFIYFDDTMRHIQEENISEHLHTLISVFIRPCRIYKYFPKKFNSSEVENISEQVKEMDVVIALELINAFFFYMISSIRNTHTEYLGQLEKAAWDKVIE